MFDKNKFAQIIKKIKETYSSQEEFSKKSEIGRTYLSQYMNMKLEEPPKPKILQKLADSSHGIVTYNELMDICGYSEKTLENSVLSIYHKLKKYNNYTANSNNSKDNYYKIKKCIEYFQKYLNYLNDSFVFASQNAIYLENILDFPICIENSRDIIGFILIYNEFLKLLEHENFIDIINYPFIDYLNKEEVYSNFNIFINLELLSPESKSLAFKLDNDSNVSFIKYINSFSRYLSLFYLSDLDNTTLFELFEEENVSKSNIENTKLYHCPVYGNISAGQPNWAEECLEGYLPIDPNLMNIINPEECFFLRVNGESMNKLVKNGAYALIRKQDIVENGEIAAVLVNGFDATLKKFTQHNDVIVLEPLSDDSSFQTQIYDKNTEIKILGKYIGKFEINN